ncbi:hypothetical protein [Bartonella refiksaydamii]|uniref:hypothetical protein n=1 Tax=Bartonella refiksaydamii TaxID=2654951 RepID=UPI0018DAF99B|nr:hypothetical protein [Bartonella refiksaydamii]
MQNQRMENAQQQANNLPYLIPSSSVPIFGSQSNPLGLSKDMEPLPDVGSSLRSAGRKPYVPSSVPSLPVATFGSQPNPLGMEPLPNAIETSDLASLKPKQSQLPEPISSVEPQKSVQPQQSTVPHQDTGSQQSFWDHLRSPEFLQRLSDYGIGYALSDGTIAQSLANGAMNLRRGDMEREKRGQVNQTVEYLKSKGYSEEEAAVMARNPQMLSAMLTGGDTPKLLPGHEWYTNPETGERGQRPMPGTLQALEYNQKKRDIEEWEINKREAADRAAYEINNTVGAINKALDIIEKNPKRATGTIGSVAQLLPATDARTLKNQLKQLEGGIFNQVIAGIKAQSKNGTVGVGPLSNEESRRIVESYGSLDISDNSEELYQRLLNIKYMFDRFKELNDEEIYRLSRGMEVRRRKKDASQSFTNQSMSQRGVENLPTISSREDIKKLAIGDRASIRHGNDMYEIIRDR